MTEISRKTRYVRPMPQYPGWDEPINAVAAVSVGGMFDKETAFADLQEYTDRLTKEGIPHIRHTGRGLYAHITRYYVLVAPEHHERARELARSYQKGPSFVFVVTEKEEANVT